MGPWMGCEVCTTGTVTETVEDTGPVLLERVSRVIPLEVEDLGWVGMEEHVSRVTVFPGETDAEMRLRNMGYVEPRV